MLLHNISYPGSGSITPSDWQSGLHFLSNVTYALKVSPTGTHGGMVQFASHARTESQLTGNMATLLAVISSVRQMTGDTNMGQGLIEAWQVFKTSGRGGPVPRVIVLVTDGKANLGPDPVQVASQLKASPYNVSIVCVGVGNSVDYNALQKIASPPISLTVFPVSDWTSLPKGELHSCPNLSFDIHCVQCLNVLLPPHVVSHA
jgi:hypothetical protein